MATKRKIVSIWIRGYGGYYVTGKRQDPQIGQTFVKSISSFDGQKVEITHWDGTGESIYTNQISIKYNSPQKE
jgi:hypothetical protein